MQGLRNLSLPCANIRHTCKRQRLTAERDGDVPQPWVNLMSRQERAGIGNFYRVSSGAGKRFVHIGDQGRRSAPGPIGHVRKRSSQRLCFCHAVTVKRLPAAAPDGPGR